MNGQPTTTRPRLSARSRSALTVTLALWLPGALVHSPGSLLCIGALTSLTVCLKASAHGAEQFELNNGQLSAVLDRAGLVRLQLAGSTHHLEVAGDAASLDINGQRLAMPGLPLRGVTAERERVTYSYEANGDRLDIVYELKAGWHFLSKHAVLSLTTDKSIRVGAVEVFRGTLSGPIASEHRAGRSTGAVFLRLGPTDAAPQSGAFLVLQNPFLDWSRTDGEIAMAYAAEIDWHSAYGSFASDRVCIGLYALSGQEYPTRNVPEWKYLEDPERALDNLPKLDWAETDSVIRCVEQFQLDLRTRSLRVHVPWCENDYQIDIATPAGRAEWKRIIDQAAAVGCQHAIFTPANSEVAPQSDNADAWGWENLLWLGLGQKIRTGQWSITDDPIPPPIQEMLDYAQSKQLQLLAYVYPTLPWKQNPEWTAWCQGRTGGYIGADTGVRSFQDWLIDQLVAFHERTGISGYSFDHWWIAYEPTDEFTPTSRYAQWYGCRRVLEELRRRIPDVVIDGRQQYHWFGPWTWLAGSYPHPSMNDEQPDSFENFPDLHFSRVSANRQRWAAWWFRMEQMTPLDLLPGYMTHQTPRHDADGQCVRDRAFHTRDWDYLGWRYSVLASLATAPFNHVVDLLPARDEVEFAHFGADDQNWLRQWMDWTDTHRDVLRQLRPVIGPPMLGRIDGTAAIHEDHGFIFLFNPNYRDLDAVFPLDSTIGITKGDRFVLRELYPREGRLWGNRQAGPWNFGQEVRLRMKGPQAMVLELVPAERLPRPAVLNASGRARLNAGHLLLESVEGEVGTQVDLTVLLPADVTVSSVSVNGHDSQPFAQTEDRGALSVTFAGEAFEHCQQIGTYDRHFTSTIFRGEFRVPQRIFDQLVARRDRWPVPYTDEERLATWRAPDRLLLYIHIADPQDTWQVAMTLNGRPIEVRRAYSDVFPLGRERTFTGFYADVSRLVVPDTRNEIELTLPAQLQPGQFQGLFFENVESTYTTEVSAVK